MEWRKAASIFEGGSIALALAQEVCAQPAPPYLPGSIALCVADDHAVAQVEMSRGKVNFLLQVWSGGAGVEVVSGRYRAQRTLAEPSAAEIWDAIEAMVDEVDR